MGVVTILTVLFLHNQNAKMIILAYNVWLTLIVLTVLEVLNAIRLTICVKNVQTMLIVLMIQTNAFLAFANVINP